MNESLPLMCLKDEITHDPNITISAESGLDYRPSYINLIYRQFLSVLAGFVLIMTVDWTVDWMYPCIRKKFNNMKKKEPYYQRVRREMAKAERITKQGMARWRQENIGTYGKLTREVLPREDLEKWCAHKRIENKFIDQERKEREEERKKQRKVPKKNSRKGKKQTRPARL